MPVQLLLGKGCVGCGDKRSWKIAAAAAAAAAVGSGVGKGTVGNPAFAAKGTVLRHYLDWGVCRLPGLGLLAHFHFSFRNRGI